MSESKETSWSVRIALWRANKKTCFFCGEPVEFADLEIDHLVPKTSSEGEVREYVRKLALGSDFGLHTCRNLVPTHHSCNRRKSDHRFSESALRYYFELWARKQGAVRKELDRIHRDAVTTNALEAIIVSIERGDLTSREVMTAIDGREPVTRADSIEPWVVTFGSNISELLAADSLPTAAPQDYPHLCDWLEERLLKEIQRRIPTTMTVTESYRDGEVLSVRVALRHLNVDQLHAAEISPLEVLEIARYSDLYDVSWADLFLRAP